MITNKVCFYSRVTNKFLFQYLLCILMANWLIRNTIVYVYKYD